MTSGAPWSVKGIDPKAREVAKDLARRSGMTLGEWLNRMILEEDGPEDIASESYFTDPTYAAKTFVAERPARTYIETPRQEVFKAPEPPLRPEPLYVAPTRFEAPEHPGDEIARVTVALDRLTDRIENSEGRTGKAISGVEHSVREAVERIESAEREHVAIAARFEGAVEDTRTEQARLSERLRRMESEAAGPRSAEALRALEQALGRVANHLYEGENRTRQTLADLRERVERAEAGAPAPSVEVIEEVVERVGARLTEAEARTSEALEGLRASFAGLDGRVRTVETEAPANLDKKLEHFAANLTATLTERVEATRGELAKSLETASEGRFDRMERKLSEMTDQVRAAEERSAQAIERVGREVLTVADNLNRRVQVSETRSADAIEHVGGEIARIAQTVETRLTRNDTVQAEAMEKLGAEIARISERLAERIANAERRSAQAFDDVGEQVARVSERIGVHGDRASDELVERIRLSEERTARLLDEAREKIDQRLGETQRRIAEQVAAAPLVSAPTYADPVKAFGEPEPFPAFEAEEPPAPRPAGQATMQTTGLTTRSGFATPRPMSAIAPQVIAPQAPAPQVVAPLAMASQALAAQAAEAPAVFAPEPFPGAAQASTFDAEDFEAADGFADLSETTAEAAPEGDLEAEDFAPELELVEEGSALSSGFGPSAFEALDAEDSLDAEAEEHRSEAFDALDSATPEDPKDETLAYSASAFDLADDEEAQSDPAFARSAFAPLEEEEDHSSKLPLSTREVIEQARAAARAAVENDSRGRWPKTSPKAKAEKAEKSVPSASLFSSMFGGRAKRRAGSSLQTALVVMGTAALVSLGAAGFMLMDGHPGGAPPKRVSDALAALSGGRIKEVVAPEHDTTPFPATPRVAVALSPQPIVPAGSGQPTAPDLSDRFGKAAQGVKAGTPGAIEELKAVAELGHAPAQFYLARLYEKGEGGLKVDLAASRRWTERAAEGGDPRAMHNVGMAYINGSGGPKNSTTAAQWFRRAADLGLVDSQFNLAALYEKGLGVSQNPAEAYKWYLIAAKTGDGDARQRADQVRGQLTSDARAVAEQAATAFRPAARNPSAAPVATAAVGGDNAGVIVAQRALSRLGYYLGPTDGSASPALQLAIAAYQRDHNTPVTGVLDQSTLQGLSVYTR